MENSDKAFSLETRDGLPQDVLFLSEAHPKSGWNDQLHFSRLAQTWLGIHRVFRTQIHRIDKGVEAVLNGDQDAGELLPQFRSDVEGLLSHLDQYHQIEDYHYFPQFQQIEPRLIMGFEIMEQDHHVIAEAISTLSGQSREFVSAVKATKQDASETDRVVNALKETVTKFRSNMQRHLDDEEDLVIPLVVDRHIA